MGSTDGQTVNNLAGTEGDTVTIYAQWTRKSTYAVAVTAGEGMTKTGGEESQTVDVTTAMTSVVYIASEGYYFPTDYSVTAVNGIRRSRLM